MSLGILHGEVPLKEHKQKQKIKHKKPQAQFGSKYNLLYFFSPFIYLKERERVRESEQEHKQGLWEKEKQVSPSRDPQVGYDPGTLGP